MIRNAIKSRKEQLLTLHVLRISGFWFSGRGGRGVWNRVTQTGLVTQRGLLDAKGSGDAKESRTDSGALNQKDLMDK